MNTIDEVKKIEQRAAELELSYNDKIKTMEKTTETKIAEMRLAIEQDLTRYQEKQDEERQDKLKLVEKQMKEEAQQEIQTINMIYENKQHKLVDIVIEEVMKQYGNR